MHNILKIIFNESINGFQKIPLTMPLNRPLKVVTTRSVPFGDAKNMNSLKFSKQSSISRWERKK
jgi:hypothetical protein